MVGSRDNCSPSASDSIGAIAFDPTNEWLATGGMSRKIRLYHFNSLLTSVPDTEEDAEENDHATVNQKERREYKKTIIDQNRTKAVICTPAKLSSLKWNPVFGEQVIGCGDYDGVVTEWDIERGLATYERDEHGGRKVWSIDYSSLNTSLCASASDDGTVQIWDKKPNKTVMVISSPLKKPVCCAEFSPCNANLIAMACCDHRVYVHDIRRVSSPLFTLYHHSKPASYVRFFRENMVVSASIDGSIKLWDISKSLPGGLERFPVRTYTGHCNAKNFVGLSVWQEGGLLACGSESNQVFAYDYRWGSPVWLHEFDGTLSEVSRNDLCFVSCVCWRQKPSDCTLVAANSHGMLQVIVGKRRTTM
eukprot:Gb_09448 [translate_table: standard]